MSIRKRTLQFLSRPGKNIVILDIADVLAEYESVFQFVEDIRHWSDTEWGTDFLRRETDDGEGSRIVFASYPSKIRDTVVTGERIYIIEDTTEVQPALTYFKL